MKHGLVLFLIFVAMNAFSFPNEDKSAESFITLLERHDYWKRASTRGTDAKPQTPLENLQSLNPNLIHLDRYSRIHMDYGNQRKEQDPHHLFTCLELQFHHNEDIPFANDSKIQRYPRCFATDQLNALPDSLMSQAFPLWKYQELVHQRIQWQHLEYIKWYGIRYHNYVYIIYTIPVMWIIGIIMFIIAFTSDTLTFSTITKFVIFISIGSMVTLRAFTTKTNHKEQAHTRDKDETELN